MALLSALSVFWSLPVLAAAAVAIAVLTARLRAAKDQLGRLVRELADAERTDALTGTLNQRGFDERLHVELERKRRTRQPISILRLDLDGFRHVNDSHGLARGDDALRRLSEVLGSAVRGTDFVGRIGGDEFVVGLPDTDSSAAAEVAERIRYLVEYRFRTEGLPLTVTCGVATSDEDDGNDAFVAAYRALSSAKAGRPNAVLAA